MRASRGRMKGGGVVVLILTAGMAWSFGGFEEVHLGGGWESRYVAEGRDAYNGAGQIIWDAGAREGPVFGNIWYGLAEDGKADELNLTVGTGHVAGRLEGWLLATRLEFPKEGGFDHELAAGAGWSWTERMNTGLSLTYSTEMEGIFAALFFDYGVPLVGDWLVGEIVLVQGIDFGYATEAHDGPNHFQAGFNLAWTLAESMVLRVYVFKSWAQTDVRREGLDHVSWGGVSLIWSR